MWKRHEAEVSEYLAVVAIQLRFAHECIVQLE